MVGFVIIVAGLAIGMESVPYLWRRYLRHRRLVPVRRQGRQLGLVAGPDHGLLCGDWSQHRVEVRIRSHLRKTARVTLRLQDPALAQVPAFRLVVEDLSVDGSPLAAAAAVSTSMKAALHPGDRLELKGDGLALDVPVSDLSPWLRLLEQSVRDLTDPAPLEDRVLKRLSEPDARLRRFALQALIRCAPDTIASRTALDRARSDPQAWVRMQAHLQDQDQDLIYGIAIDPESEMELVEQGLRALDEQGRSEALVHVLSQRRRSPSARRTALCAAVEPGPVTSVALEAALRDTDRHVRERAVQAHGQLQDAEPRLLDLLEGRHACLAGLDYFERMRLASSAADVLGRVGTARCMGPLRRLCEGAGLLAPLAEPARKALAQLEQRCGSTEGGSLSLAVGSTGALSLGSPERPDQ